MRAVPRAEARTYVEEQGARLDAEKKAEAAARVKGYGRGEARAPERSSEDEDRPPGKSVAAPKDAGAEDLEAVPALVQKRITSDPNDPPALALTTAPKGRKRRTPEPGPADADADADADAAASKSPSAKRKPQVVDADDHAVEANPEPAPALKARKRRTREP
jgi:hypothetical protein